jgi:TolB protein
MRGSRAAAVALAGATALLLGASGTTASGRRAQEPAGLPESLLNHDVVVMSADGSRQRNLTRTIADELGPVWSPDSSKIAYFAPGGKGRSSEVFVMDADGSHKRNLTRNSAFDCCPVWSPDGRRIAFYSRRGPAGTESDIFTMTRNGLDQRNLTKTVAGDVSPAWSPDSAKIAFVSGPPEHSDEIYLMNADGSAQVNLTQNPAADSNPVWSPDGTRIAFVSRGRGAASPDIVVMNADGSGQTDLTPDLHQHLRPAWSPDGRRIAFQGYGWYGNNDIYVMNPDGTEKKNLTPENPNGGDGSPAWSPDGRKIAYATHFSFRPSRRLNREIFAMNEDGTEKRDLTENPVVDDFPVWSSDGEMIAFTRRSPICRVPYVIGRSLAYARMQIRLWKCTLGRVRYRRSHRDRGLVLEISPRPGRLFLYHTQVRLVVSSGN